MKRVLAFLLACLMILPSLVACGNEKKAAGGANIVIENEGADTPDLPTVEEIGDISGEFYVLVAGNWEWNDFEAEADSTNVVESAIYKRNQYILDKYDVEIVNEDIVKYSSAMGSGDGYKKLYNNYMAGDHIYDAAMIGTYDIANLALNGILYDLNDVEHIDLGKSYWDQKANADLSMNGKMYYTTGDISVADNRATYVLFFSKSMIDMYGLESPYDLVRDNEWTLEKFGEMVKTVGTDNNNDGIYGKEDTFGLLTPTDTHLAILAAADERIATINDEGKLELTFYNERVVNLYDAYLNIASDHSHSYNYQYNYATGKTGLTSTNEERVSMFNNNQGLFYSHTMFYMDHLRDIENDFGIIPYPKYDASQDSYGNLVSAWHAQFLCVPDTATPEVLSRTGIILEELAYMGDVVLTPAYYEKTLHGQYVRDEESSEMLDIIFANLVYDMGIYYNVGTYKEKLTSIVRTGQTITTLYEENRTSAEAKVDEINNKFFEN